MGLPIPIDDHLSFNVIGANRNIGGTHYPKQTTESSQVRTCGIPAKRNMNVWLRPRLLWQVSQNRAIEHLPGQESRWSNVSRYHWNLRLQ